MSQYLDDLVMQNIISINQKKEIDNYFAKQNLKLVEVKNFTYQGENVFNCGKCFYETVHGYAFNNNKNYICYSCYQQNQVENYTKLYENVGGC